MRVYERLFVNGRGMFCGFSYLGDWGIAGFIVSIVRLVFKVKKIKFLWEF